MYTLFTLVPILSYLASKAFLKQADTFYEFVDRMAYKANQRGYTRSSRLIKWLGGSKLFWCNPCQTFWLTLAGLSWINLVHAIMSALITFTFLKLKEDVQEQD